MVYIIQYIFVKHHIPKTKKKSNTVFPRLLGERQHQLGGCLGGLGGQQGPQEIVWCLGVLDHLFYEKNMVVLRSFLSYMTCSSKNHPFNPG